MHYRILTSWQITHVYYYKYQTIGKSHIISMKNCKDFYDFTEVLILTNVMGVSFIDKRAIDEYIKRKKSRITNFLFTEHYRNFSFFQLSNN